MSVSNLKKSYEQELSSGQIKIITGDGRLGYQPDAPYDAIHVGAAADVIPPALLNQLAPGGSLIIPVGIGMQQITHVKKDLEGKLHYQKLLDVRYVPLTDKEL